MRSYKYPYAIDEIYNMYSTKNQCFAPLSLYKKMAISALLFFPSSCMAMKGNNAKGAHCHSMEKKLTIVEKTKLKLFKQEIEIEETSVKSTQEMFTKLETKFLSKGNDREKRCCVAAYNLGFYLLDEYTSPLTIPPLALRRNDCEDLWRDVRNPSISAFIRFNRSYVNTINNFIKALYKEQSMPNIAQLTQPDIDQIGCLEAFFDAIMQEPRDIVLFSSYSHFFTRYESKEYTEKIIATTLNKDYFKKIIRLLKVRVTDSPADEPIDTTNPLLLPISHPESTMLWYQHEDPIAIASDDTLSDLREKAKHRFEQRNSQSAMQALYTQRSPSFCIYERDLSRKEDDDNNKGKTHAFYTVKLPGVPAFYQTSPLATKPKSNNKTYLLSLSGREKLFRLHLK
jgi:hypothetical protein